MPLVHLVVGVVHAVKVYREHGKLIKYCKVVNYAPVLYCVVMLHSKLARQYFHSINVEMQQNWIHHLLDNFAGYVVERLFQGDGTGGSITCFYRWLCLSS